MGRLVSGPTSVDLVIALEVPKVLVAEAHPVIDVFLHVVPDWGLCESDLLGHLKLTCEQLLRYVWTL